MGAHPGRAANPRIHKENPMSLGVLNNLSAMYAENNLNNTTNSLNDSPAAVVFRVEDQLRRG
jgi:hypothetical protein